MLDCTVFNLRHTFSIYFSILTRHFGWTACDLLYAAFKQIKMDGWMDDDMVWPGPENAVVVI